MKSCLGQKTQNLKKMTYPVLFYMLLILGIVFMYGYFIERVEITTLRFMP